MKINKGLRASTSTWSKYRSEFASYVNDSLEQALALLLRDDDENCNDNNIMCFNETFQDNDNDNSSTSIITRAHARMTRNHTKELLMSENNRGENALFWAIRRNGSAYLVQKMIDVGGYALISKCNRFGQNALHYACFFGSNYHVFQALLLDHIGTGTSTTVTNNSINNSNSNTNANKIVQELLTKKDRHGNTPLHYACAWHVPIEVIKFMLQKGGMDILYIQNNWNYIPSPSPTPTTTPTTNPNPKSHNNIPLQLFLSNQGGEKYDHLITTQTATIHEMSIFDLIMLNLVEEVQRKLTAQPINKRYIQELYEKDDLGINTLMDAIWHIGHINTSTHINTLSTTENTRTENSEHRSHFLSMIQTMVDVGGKDLVLMTNNTGSNSLHHAAYNQSPLDVIILLLHAAGTPSIHIQNYKKQTMLHVACINNAPVEVVQYLIKLDGKCVSTNNNNNNNSNSCVGLLLKAKNINNNTPLEEAYTVPNPSEQLIVALQRTWYEVDPNCIQKSSTHLIKQTLQWSRKFDAHIVTSNNFLKSVLNESFCWPRYQIVLFSDVYFHLCVNIFISPFRTKMNQFYIDHNDTSGLGVSVVVLSICGFWFLFREIIEMFSIKNYARSYKNLLNIIFVVFVCWTIYIFVQLQQQENENESIDDDNGGGVGGNDDDDYLNLNVRGVIIVTCMISSIEFLLSIGQLSYSVSVFTYAIIQVSVSFKVFQITFMKDFKMQFHITSLSYTHSFSFIFFT